MRLVYHVMSSPVGLLFLARTERGLRHLEFMDRRSLKRTIAAHATDAPGAVWEPSLLELKPIVDQLEGYFSGTTDRFDVPLDALGTAFQVEVWKALLAIPYAATRSYGDIAKAIGQPKATRAVGLANNQNPVAIVVPCHRVIGADGSLTGYGGGVTRKRWLLEHEARFARLDRESRDGMRVVRVQKPGAMPRRAAVVAPKPAGAAVARRAAEPTPAPAAPRGRPAPAPATAKVRPPAPKSRPAVSKSRPSAPRPRAAAPTASRTPPRHTPASKKLAPSDRTRRASR